jgi:hypothetical protein
MLGFSLAVFVYIYLLLLVVDIWLMRRYARLDPPELWHRAASVRVGHVTSALNHAAGGTGENRLPWSRYVAWRGPSPIAGFAVHLRQPVAPQETLG